MDENAYDHFQYAIDYPLEGERRWMGKLERLVACTPQQNECVVWVYVFDRLNYRYGSP